LALETEAVLVDPAAEVTTQLRSALAQTLAQVTADGCPCVLQCVAVCCSVLQLRSAFAQTLAHVTATG